MPESKRQYCRLSRESYPNSRQAVNECDYVEGYPVKGEFTIDDLGGSASMYIGQGFEIIDIHYGHIPII